MIKGKGMTVLFPVVLAGLMLMAAGKAVSAANADMQIVMPATAGDILEAIDEETTELEDIIKQRQFSEVHHHALVIRDLTKGLLTHTEGLSVQQINQLQDEVKAASVIIQHLDASGRAKDKTETVENFSQLQHALNEMKGQYVR